MKVKIEKKKMKTIHYPTENKNFTIIKYEIINKYNVYVLIITKETCN